MGVGRGVGGWGVVWDGAGWVRPGCGCFEEAPDHESAVEECSNAGSTRRRDDKGSRKQWIAEIEVGGSKKLAGRRDEYHFSQSLR